MMNRETVDFLRKLEDCMKEKEHNLPNVIVHKLYTECPVTLVGKFRGLFFGCKQAQNTHSFVKLKCQLTICLCCLLINLYQNKDLTELNEVMVKRFHEYNQLQEKIKVNFHCQFQNGGKLKIYLEITEDVATV